MPLSSFCELTSGVVMMPTIVFNIMTRGDAFFAECLNESYERARCHRARVNAKLSRFFVDNLLVTRKIRIMAECAHFSANSKQNILRRSRNCDDVKLSMYSIDVHLCSSVYIISFK